MLNEAQLHYLKTVLGLGSFGQGAVVPQDTNGPVAPSWQLIDSEVTAPAKIILVTSEFSSPDATDLREKMMRALQLGPETYAILEWRSGKTIPTEVQDYLRSSKAPILVFGLSTLQAITGQMTVTLGETVSWQGVRLFATFSLPELLERQDKKKTAWAHLQNFANDSRLKR